MMVMRKRQRLVQLGLFLAGGLVCAISSYSRPTFARASSDWFSETTTASIQVWSATTSAAASAKTVSRGVPRAGQVQQLLAMTTRPAKEWFEVGEDSDDSIEIAVAATTSMPDDSRQLTRAETEEKHAAFVEDLLKSWEKRNRLRSGSAELPLPPDLPASDRTPPRALSPTEESATTNPLQVATGCQAERCLQVFRDEQTGKWQVHPRRLMLDMSADRQSWQVERQGEGSPLLFVRDPQILRWHAKRDQLKAQSVGKTELYIVGDQNMLIVPVRISQGQQPVTGGAAQGQQGEKPLADLPVAEDLAELERLDGVSLAASAAAGGEQANPIAVNAFSDDGAAVDAGEAAAKPQFEVVTADLGLKTLALQVVDERSVMPEQRLYPVKDARVRVLGTGITAQTNVRGEVQIDGVPEGSRLLLHIDHEGGLVPAHTFEIYADTQNRVQEEQLQVMTYRSMFAYEQVYQVAQRDDRASLCMTARTRDGAQTLDGLEVAINVDAEGPFYFNRFGPDAQAAATGVDGRFCFFNVLPGLVEISFYEDGDYLSSAAVPLLAGSHLVDDVFLWNGAPLELRLTAMPTALEQLYSDYDRYMTFYDIDYVDLLAIGDNLEIPLKQAGVLMAEAGHSWYRGKSYFLSQAAEFEPVLYSFDQAMSGLYGFRPVIPLLPRGFIEELFRELYLVEGDLTEAYDPAMGSVLVFHGHPRTQDADGLQITLHDESGRAVKDGWYFGSGADGLLKAVFFNLEPGIYSVVVRNAKGDWLDFDTVAVDYWTTSFAQTGHPLREVRGPNSP
jgi:hypothetical protein